MIIWQIYWWDNKPEEIEVEEASARYWTRGGHNRMAKNTRHYATFLTEAEAWQALATHHRNKEAIYRREAEEARKTTEAAEAGLARCLNEQGDANAK
jgi:hypothetical protein